MSYERQLRDVRTLLELLSVPRPNGSHALRRTAAALREHIESRGVPVRVERHRLAAFFNELLGAWMILAGTGLLAAVLLRGGWIALGVGLLAVLVPALESGRMIPVVTGLLRVDAERLVLELPAPDPQREVIVAAHYDSKTELLDHRGRLWLLRRAEAAMGLALVAGGAGAAESVLRGAGSVWATPVFALAVASALPVALFSLALGSNLLLGRWRTPPSQGTVDNGAAVGAVVELCRRIVEGEIALRHTSVTGCLFSGEEIQMQGSRAYVAERGDWPLPVHVVNLEAVGQNGGYVLFEADGTVLTRVPTDPDLTGALDDAVRKVTGEGAGRLPRINSDAFAFLRVGIPAAVLGTMDRSRGLAGLHCAHDCRERVRAPKVLECVDVLERWLEAEDQS